MANSDKDIKITPNTGESAKPKIEVVGADNATKTITVNDDGSITFDSTLTVSDLTVSGTTTTLNTETMTVEDKNIVLGSGNGTGEVVDATGITLEGGSGDDITFQYNATDNRMELKHGSSFEDFKAGTITGTFVGNVTGNATTATTATYANALNGLDDRDMAPEDIPASTDFQIFFATKEGLEAGSGNSSGNYVDVIYLDSYSDATGHDANILAFDKSTKAIYHYQADQADTNWGTAKQLAYTDSNITGSAATVTGAAQSAITSLGTLTALTGGTGDLVWDTNTLVVDSSENRVGIGTTTPDEALHVVGDIKASADLHATKVNIQADGYGTIEMGGASGAFIDMKNPFTDDFDVRFITTGTGLDIITANASSPIKLKTQGTTRVTVEDATTSVTGDLNVGSGDFFVDDSAGKVGIGTTSPNALLQIDTPDDNQAGQGLRLNRPSDGDTYHAVEFATNGTVDWSVGQNVNDAFQVYENGAGATTRFTIKEGGNVGIGTTSPSTPLHVKSTTTSLDNLLLLENDGGSGTPGVGIKMFSNVGTANYLEILHDAFGATNFKTVNGSDTYNKQVHLQSDGDVSFEAGNVAIGHASPTMALDVKGDVFIGNSDETTTLTGSGDLTVQGDTALATFKADNGSSGDQIAGIRVFADSFRSAGMMVGDYNNADGAMTEDWLFGRQYASTNKAGIFAAPENGGDEYITVNSDSQKAVKIAGDNDDIDFIIHGSSGEYLRAVASTGRVGIGTSSPMNKLQVSLSMADGDDGILIVREDTSTATNDIIGGIGFDSTDGNVPSSILEASVALVARAREDHSVDDKGGYLDFYYAPTDQDDDTTSRRGMRMLQGKLAVGGQNGDVGDPINSLVVYHSAENWHNGLLILRDDTSISDGDLLGAIGFDGKDGNNPSNILEASAGMAAYAAEDHSDSDKGGDLTFFTSPIDQDDDTTSIERMRITSEGKVIVGDTPNFTSQHDSISKFTIQGTDAGMLIEKHDDSASGGPTLSLYRYSASVADADLIGQINFRGEGDTGNPSTYMAIRTEVVDTTEGSKDGQIIFRGLQGNSQTDFMTVGSNGVRNMIGSVVAVSSNTTLTDDESGSYVYWTGGTLTLPATAIKGQQFVIINNTNGSATPNLGTSNAIATNWTTHAAMADETARTYIAVAANTWIYIG